MAGAINIQNWTNWNLLQPVNIDTDKVIKRSEVGRKYRHFDFSKLVEQKELEQLDLEGCENHSSKTEELIPEENNVMLFKEEAIYDVSLLSEDCRKVIEPLLLSTATKELNIEMKNRESLIGSGSASPQELDRIDEKIAGINKEIEESFNLRKKRREQEDELRKKLNIEMKNRESLIDSESASPQELDRIDEKIAGINKELEDYVEHPQLMDKVWEACDDKDLGHMQANNGPHIQRYKEGIESKYTPDLLKNFSLEESLKPIIFGTEEAESFIESLKEFYIEFTNSRNWSIFDYITNDFTIPEVYSLLQKHQNWFLDARPSFDCIPSFGCSDSLRIGFKEKMINIIRMI